MKTLLTALATTLTLHTPATAVEIEPTLPPTTLAAMEKVHSGFKGNSGFVAQFGDSITHSMAFWSVMDWADPDKFLTEDDGLPKVPEKAPWKKIIKGARGKGPNFANQSGWTTAQLVKAVGPVIEREKPEVAIIMIGTNDIRQGKVPDSYRADLESIVSACLSAHCIPVLNTIPPRAGREEQTNELNLIVREVASEKNLPLVDYHAHIMKLRPGTTWQKTLISADGVHPTGGKSQDYSPENLKSCGYALRNWINFQAYRQLYFKILEK